MPDVEVAESSTATEAPPMESWTSDQRSEWLSTGKAPEPAAPAPKTEESAPSAATEGEKPPKVETAPAPEPEKKQEQEPQFKAAEARKAELNREIRELLDRRKELQREVEPPKAEAAAEPTSDDPEPLTTAYATGADGSMTVEDLQKFQRDHSRWTIRQDRKAEAAARAKQVHEERLNEVRGKHEDFDDVIEANGHSLKFNATPAGPAMYRAIFDAEQVSPLELLYHLTKNPAEFRRIAALHPRKAIAEIVKLEESLNAPPEKKETPPPAPIRKQTTAPPPATELAARNSGEVDEVLAAVKEDDFTRFKRLEDARELKKLRRA